MIRRPTLTMLLSIATVLALVPGCAKHKDFPQPLGVTAPPNVANLSVTTGDNISFDLAWDPPADPSEVQFYRIYYIFEGLEPTFVGESATTAYGPIDFQIMVSGVSFGVSVVTLDNVEGAMVVATP